MTKRLFCEKSELGVFAQRPCPLGSWLPYHGVPQSGRKGRPTKYAITLSDGVTYDQPKTKTTAHFVNELPEDFLTHTLRMAYQCILDPTKVTIYDKQKLQHSILHHSHILEGLFQPSYNPLVTFGKHCTKFYVQNENGEYCRVVSGFTRQGSIKLENRHGEQWYGRVSATTRRFEMHEGFVSLVGDKETRVYAHPLFPNLEAFEKKVEDVLGIDLAHHPSNDATNTMDLLCKAMVPNCLFVDYCCFSSAIQRTWSRASWPRETLHQKKNGTSTIAWVVQWNGGETVTVTMSRRGAITALTWCTFFAQNSGSGTWWILTLCIRPKKNTTLSPYC